MTNLTARQYALMDLIAHHEYNAINGATPEKAADVNTWLWADEFAKELGETGKAVGGLLTTLTEKGFIGVNKVKKVKGQADESGVWFTDDGFAAWAAHRAALAAPTEEPAAEQTADYAFNEGTNSAGEPAAPTEEPKAEAKKRGPAAQYADDMVITVLVANPKRPNSKAFARFALYATGMTVREAMTAGLRRDDFRWDVMHAHIEIK
jgi:hypothetical protein